MKGLRKSIGFAKAKQRLALLRHAVETYWRIICGEPEPDTTTLLHPKWRAKKKELVGASGYIGFDLLRLAKIFESVKGKITDAYSPRLPANDPVTNTAMQATVSVHGREESGCVSRCAP